MMEQQIVQLQQEIKNKENDIDVTSPSNGPLITTILKILLEENIKRKNSASKRYAEVKSVNQTCSSVDLILLSYARSFRSE